METRIHTGLFFRILIIIAVIAGFNLSFCIENNIFVVKKIDWREKFEQQKNAFFKAKNKSENVQNIEEKIQDYKDKKTKDRTMQITTTIEKFLEGKNFVNGVYFFKPDNEFLTKVKENFSKPIDFFYLQGADGKVVSIESPRPKEIFKIAPDNIAYPYRKYGWILIAIAILGGIFYRPFRKNEVIVRFADSFHSYLPDVIAFIALFLLTLLFSGVSIEIGMKLFSGEWKILYGIYLIMSFLISIIPLTTGYYRNFFIKVENNELLIRHYSMQQKILINQIEEIKSCMYSQPLWKRTFFFFARVLAATRPERKLVEANDEEGFALILQNKKELVFSREKLVGLNELHRILKEKGVETSEFKVSNDEAIEE